MNKSKRIKYIYIGVCYLIVIVLVCIYRDGDEYSKLLVKYWIITELISGVLEPIYYEIFVYKDLHKMIEDRT